MADRTTKVTLLAQVSQYTSEMERAARKTSEVGTAAEKLAAKRQAFDTLGRSALAFGTLAAAGVGVAVARFADFDAAMSSVQAATHESAGNMSLLRDAALEAGESTVFTATEAAGAIENLAKAGVSTADIMGGGLAGALDLAAAGELAVGDAAEIAATAMTQFNLEGTQVPHIADLLAAAAGKAQGSVTDMAAALNQSGLVASQMGLSLEETTGSLAAFASAGLIGSDAGTSFRQMLLRLANPTEESKELMSQLGIAAYDAGGNFVGMESIAGQLQEKLGGLTQSQRDSTLATLFGSDAIRAANVLYTEGSDGIAEWTANVDDAGYAAETAALRLDNLQGDVEKLGGAFDTALIKSGSAANDVLRFLTQAATDAVDGFNNLDPSAQGAALAVGGVVSAASLAGGAFFVAVPKIAEFNTALETMGPGAQRAGRAIGGVTKALGIFAALGAVGIVAGEISDSFRDIGMGVEEATAAILDNNLSEIFQGISGDVDNFGSGLKLLFNDDINSSMERFGSFANGIFGGALPDQVRDTREAFATTGEALANLVNSGDPETAADQFNLMAEAAALHGVSTEQLLDLMPAYQETLSGVSNEQALAAGTADENTAALDALGGAATSADTDIQGLADTIRGFGSAAIDAEEAAMQFEAAIDDASAAVEKNGQTLNKGTEAGRANRNALLDIAKAALQNSAATLTRTGSEEKARGAVEAGRAALIRAAQQMGLSRAEAERYANKLGLIPKNVGTAVKLNGTAAAEGALQRLTRARQATINVVVTGAAGVGGAGANRVAANGGLWSYADGGIQSFAGGGYPNGIYKGGTPLYQFAEPETGWEAFISGKRGQEKRNLGFALEAISRLAPKAGLYPTGHGMGGGSSRVVNVNVQQTYPINEPGSEGVRRAGQLAGAVLGGM